MNELREAKNSEDKESIQTKTEALSSSLQKIGEIMQAEAQQAESTETPESNQTDSETVEVEAEEKNE